VCPQRSSLTLRARAFSPAYLEFLLDDLGRLSQRELARIRSHRTPAKRFDLPGGPYGGIHMPYDDRLDGAPPGPNSGGRNPTFRNAQHCIFVRNGALASDRRKPRRSQATREKSSRGLATQKKLVSRKKETTGERSPTRKSRRSLRGV